MKNLFLTAVLVCLSFPAFADEDALFKATTLDISATAEAKAVPDIAIISAGVTTQSPVADKALQENSRKMNGIFKALKGAGIEDKDMQTSGVNVSPMYAYEENKAPRITSYQVNDGVTVVLRDIKNIGAVLDALVSQGANQMSGPDFSVEDKDSLLDTARKVAMDKAQKRAALYASASGLKIKRIISISEQTNYSSPRPMMMKAMAMAADMPRESTPVASGQVTFDATVNVRYELTP